MKKENKKKSKFSRIEKLLFVVIVGLLVSLPVVNVYSKALVSKTNIEVEQLKYDIKKQTSINESLDMKISELASLDKIQEVANAYGMSYNNDNIKVIKDNK